MTWRSRAREPSPASTSASAGGGLDGEVVDLIHAEESSADRPLHADYQPADGIGIGRGRDAEMAGSALGFQGDFLAGDKARPLRQGGAHDNLAGGQLPPNGGGIGIPQIQRQLLLLGKVADNNDHRLVACPRVDEVDTVDAGDAGDFPHFTAEFLRHPGGRSGFGVGGGGAEKEVA